VATIVIMSGAIQAPQAADKGRLELAAIVAALSAEYAVATGAKRRVRRRRLDTLDRRLRGAGLRLEHQSVVPRRRLVLGRRAGSTVTVPVTDQRWPEPADILPGPVRDVVATVTGIRAMVVTSDEMRRVQLLELEDEEGKTVARVELDEPVSPAPAPAQFTVRRFARLRRA
jgi:hypothetical protein